MHPNPLIVRAYALRGLRLWVGTRVLVSLVLMWAETHPLRLSAGAIIQLILLSVTVCFVDTWRHRERALLGNLAVSPLVLAGLFSVPSILGETVLVVVASHLFA
ncbi:MAG: hypothetical protein ACT4R6_11870 [Gemmatimonadaceae bacterium]